MALLVRHHRRRAEVIGVVLGIRHDLALSCLHCRESSRCARDHHQKARPHTASRTLIQRHTRLLREQSHLQANTNIFRLLDIS